MIIFLFMGCVINEKTTTLDGEPSSLRLSLQQSDVVSNVIWASVESDSPTDYFLHIDSDQTYLNTITFNTESHPRVPLLGIPPGAEARITLQSVGQDQTQLAQSTIEAGALSSQIGQLQFIVGENTFSSGYWLFSLFSNEQSLALIVDMDGRVLWGLKQGDEGFGGIDVQLSDDQDSIWMNLTPVGDDRSATTLEQFALDGEHLQSIQTPNAHHLFDIEGEDSFLWMQYDLRETEEYGTVCGDRLMKNTPDEGNKSIFSSWDHLSLFETGSWNFGIPLDCKDWTHGNGIEYDSIRDSYLVTFAGADVIMELDTNGHPLQTIGGLASQDNDYDYTDIQDAFSYPHGATWGPNGEILMMSTIDNISEAAAYTVENGMIEKTWSFGSEYGHRALNLGGVRQITPEYRMINWGSVGRLQVLDSEDMVVFDMETELGMWIAEVTYLPNLPHMMP